MFDSMSIWSQYLFMLITAIGFNVETVQYNNIKFQVWDLGVLSVRELLLHFLALLFWVLSDFGLLHRLYSAMSLGSNQVMCGHGRGSNEHQVLNFLVLFYFHGCNLAVGLTVYYVIIRWSSVPAETVADRIGDAITQTHKQLSTWSIQVIRNECP
jgi:hypothetical protein